ncbi:hypothetical protein M8C21_004420 [Ambrosia artemisiifolia]|uniref:Uncharacterized protein n=1 Tax=Ambrosia artemisiifolia TaxID=4212 RepID=A0AAD5GVK3_AMBAR|nr:hypothetical protein M8C21_004420 [Ambrosia artemisiifolia]
MGNASCVFAGCIDQASVGIVEKWGRFEKLAEPGLNFFNPCAAQRLQLASVYKGEADKILQVKKAEAEAEAKYLGGVGVARQRQAITDGLRENILNFSHKVEGASAKEVMDLIMITQYFDTIKDLGSSSNNTTVFIPHGPGHVRDIGDQIRNGLMEAKAGAI